jgi:hypothetical protein
MVVGGKWRGISTTPRGVLGMWEIEKYGTLGEESWRRGEEHTY